MLRVVSVSVLLLLLCSCVQKQPEPSVSELIARAQEQRRLWDKKFAQLPGTHINGLIQSWGEPEKLKNNEYRWFKESASSYGGGYVADGYTTSKVYISGQVGYIYTPKERYVEPWVFEAWCEIRVRTDKKGLITHTSLDGSGIASPALYCDTHFPLK